MLEKKYGVLMREADVIEGEVRGREWDESVENVVRTKKVKVWEHECPPHNFIVVEPWLHELFGTKGI